MQKIIVYILVGIAVLSLAYKFLKPYIKRKSSDPKPPVEGENLPKKDCDKSCNCN